ncbi:MAG: LysR substrate-binding domain-containing protein, partial [Magnetovibrio sp.]|nr:LysR substrate-binding domain-containing protein [Magnetovibrio sp.]
MITFRQLQYLVAIADELHFGRAAKRLNVAQPTLSIQFSTLEQKLGRKLIERDRKSVFVTPLGREVVERARQILNDVQGLSDFVNASRSELSGKLKLGVPPTLGPYLLPHMVPVMHKRYPRLKLYIREGTPQNIQDALVRGELDMVLTPSPIVHSTLKVCHLFEEALFVVGAPDHELCSKPEIALEDLRGQKILTLETGHHLHAQVRQLCDAHGAEMLFDYEGTSLDTLRHMVGMGTGLSFFPELYILSEMRSQKEVKVIQLKGPKISREVCMAWRAGHGLSD